MFFVRQWFYFKQTDLTKGDNSRLEMVILREKLVNKLNECLNLGITAMILYLDKHLGSETKLKTPLKGCISSLFDSYYSKATLLIEGNTQINKDKLMFDSILDSLNQNDILQKADFLSKTPFQDESALYLQLENLSLSGNTSNINQAILSLLDLVSPSLQMVQYFSIKGCFSQVKQ